MNDQNGRWNTEFGNGSEEVCEKGQTAVTLEFSMNSDAELCSFDLREKGSDSGIRVSSLSGGFTKQAYCQELGVYVLTLKKKDKSGWQDNYVRVKLADSSTVLKASLRQGLEEEEFVFSLLFPVPPTSSSWHYTYAPQPSSQWTLLSSSHSSWQFGLPGAFAKVASITQYFTTVFSVYSLASFVSLRLGAVVYAGAVFYLNGVEVHRVNMGRGVVTSETTASNSFSKPTWCFVSVSLLRGIVQEGDNRFSVELHCHNRYEETMSFDASALLLADDSLLTVNGQGFSLQGVASAAFDNNPLTDFTAPSCADTVLTWNFGSFHEVVTKYVVRPSAVCADHAPSAWVFEASNSSVWTTLQIKTGVSFSGAERAFHFFNTQPFSTYRLRVTACEFSSSSCGSGGLALADLLLFAHFDQPYCFMDEFPPSLLGETSYLECPPFSTGMRSVFCRATGFSVAVNNCSPTKPEYFVFPQNRYVFVVNQAIPEIEPLIGAWNFNVMVVPSLPEGVSVDIARGSLSGVPKQGQGDITYTFVAANRAGEVRAELTIAVERSMSAVLWTIGEIVIALVVLVFLVLVIRLIRSRSLQHRRNLQKQSAEEESV